MKRVIGCLSGVLSLFICCGSSYALDAILSAGEITALLTDTTMQVTEAKKEKKTGRVISYQAYFSDAGAIRTQHPDGTSESFSWSVNSDDSLCVLNNIRLWGSGPFCGYLLKDNQGGYRLYPLQPVSSEKNKKYVSVKKGEHVLTLSGLRKGNHL